MAAYRRKRIPLETETRVLVSSRRRCCLCVHLLQNIAERKGQIAHIDQDPSNNDIENLVFLCLDHHDEFDRGRSQAKGITASEIRYARRSLQGFLARLERKVTEARGLNPERTEYELEVRPCSMEDVYRVFDLGVAAVGLNHPPLQPLILRYLVNPGIITCIKRRSTSRETLVGYYIVYPINLLCDRLIRVGEIRVGPEILPEHVCASEKEASAVYIAMLYGMDRHSRAFATYSLRAFVESLLLQHRGIGSIYARPATSFGARLLRAYHFDPVGSGSDVCVFSADRVRRESFALRRV